MKKADIEVGASYRASRDYPLYGARVRVLEKDVPRPGPYYGHRRVQRGTRVVVERGAGGLYFRAERGKEFVVLSRALVAPWVEADDREADEREARRVQRKALEARVEGIEGLREQGGGVYIDPNHVDEFLDRAGVPR